MDHHVDAAGPRAQAPLAQIPLAQAPRAAEADGRIPVLLLTGFLGAGKTTLLNHLIRQPAFEGTALLINEFGSIGIDHHLVQHLGETMVLLEAGCVCCAVRGDLVAALRDLHDRLARRQIPEVRRVVIETTGLADPVPVIWTLMQDRFVCTRFRCDGVVTVVDAGRGAAQLDTHEEARRQVALADRLVISKPDCADRSTREALAARLAALNPSAPRLEASHGVLDAALLAGAGVYAVPPGAAALAQWLGEEEPQQSPQQEAPVACHGAEVASFSVTFDRPLPWRGFAVALGGILSTYGAALLRVKGVMNIAGLTGPVVVQAVGDVAYAPVRLPLWPSHRGRCDMRGRLVIIAEGLTPAQVEDIRARLADPPTDAAALRQAARLPLLPTRCWLGARMPVAGGALEADGWQISTFRPGRGVVRA